MYGVSVIVSFRARAWVCVCMLESQGVLSLEGQGVDHDVEKCVWKYKDLWKGRDPSSDE